MARCESCGKSIGFLHRNLIGRTRQCPACDQAAKKAAARRAARAVADARQQLIQSLATASLPRRLRVGASRGALFGVVVPVTMIIAVAGNARVDWAVTPRGNMTRRLVAWALVVGALVCWLSVVAWGWLALIGWGASAVLGTTLGAVAGARGQWDWL